MLWWSPHNGQSYREIARQQYNFSPPGTTRELDDYLVELYGLTTLELIIVPAVLERLESCACYEKGDSTGNKRPGR